MGSCLEVGAGRIPVAFRRKNVTDIQREGLRQTPAALLVSQRCGSCRKWQTRAKAWLYCGRVHVNVPLFAVSPRLLEVDLDSHCAAVFRLMPAHSHITSRKPRQGNLFSLLIDFHQAEAYDPRDKIFALLRLCNDPGIQESVIPDYNKDTSNIVRDVISHIVADGLGPRPAWISSIPFMPILTLLTQLACLEGPRTPPYIERIFVQIFSTWTGKAVLRSFPINMRGRIYMTPRLLEAAASQKDDPEFVVRLLMAYSASVNPPTMREYGGPINESIRFIIGPTIKPLGRYDLDRLYKRSVGEFIELVRPERGPPLIEDSKPLKPCKAISPDKELGFLSVAMSFGLIEIMQLFLKPGHWEPFAYNRMAVKALYVATLYRHAPTIRYLLGEGVRRGDDPKLNPFSLALHLGHSDMVDIFREHGWES